MAEGSVMRWRDFYGRVTEGMELDELWRQFKSEARSIYKFYAHEIDAVIPCANTRYASKSHPGP